jgi:hypothetical protein
MAGCTRDSLAIPIVDGAARERLGWSGNELECG